MGLTKMQKGALLFGVLLMWADQGSDIWLGVDYYTNCHSNWALISFIFTCLPTMIWIIFGLLILFTDSVDSRCLVLASAVFQPFVVTYLAYKSFTKSDVSEAVKSVLYVKLFKAIEVMLEAIPQLLFNCYVRSVQRSNTIQVVSISLSYLAVLHSLGDTFVCYHAKTGLPKLVDVLKSQAILASDITLRLGLSLMSAILFGIWPTIGWFIGLLVIIALPKIVISKMDDQFDLPEFDDKIYYLLDMLHFNGTNVPSPISIDESGYKHISKKVAANKCISYASFGIILAIMTNNLAIQQTDPTSIYFGQLRDAKNTSVVDGLNITWDCSNFCNTNETNTETFEQLNQSDVLLDKKKLSCSKFVFSTQDCLQFVYALWSLLGLCILIAMLDFFKWLEYFYPDPDHYNDFSSEQMNS